MLEKLPLDSDMLALFHTNHSFSQCISHTLQLLEILCFHISTSCFQQERRKNKNPNSVIYNILFIFVKFLFD